MGLAGKLNWLLAGDSVAEVAEVWIQKCSMRGYSHGEGEVLSHSCCIHGAMCMVILCYLQIHQRIHQKHPETGKSTGVVIFTWGEAHTASTQIGDLLPWGPGDRASHQNVGHWFPRRSTTNKTWAAVHHWQGIWVSWCWEFPLQFTLESVRCRIFRILHQSMHPTATPWRLHGSVSRRSCVQIHAVRLFLKIVVGSIRFKTWSDGLGLKIINHDTHDGRCLGKSWKNKLGQWNLSHTCQGLLWVLCSKFPEDNVILAWPLANGPRFWWQTSFIWVPPPRWNLGWWGITFPFMSTSCRSDPCCFWNIGGISSTGSFDLEDRMCSFPPVLMKTSSYSYELKLWHLRYPRMAG